MFGWLICRKYHRRTIENYEKRLQTLHRSQRQYEKDMADHIKALQRKLDVAQEIIERYKAAEVARKTVNVDDVEV